eukprot:1966197-Prymnesium_polylepis.2
MSCACLPMCPICPCPCAMRPCALCLVPMCPVCPVCPVCPCAHESMGHCLSSARRIAFSPARSQAGPRG